MLAYQVHNLFKYDSNGYMRVKAGMLAKVV